MGKAIRENSEEARLGKSFQLGMSIRAPKEGLFLSVFVDDITLAGKKQNMNPIWKVLDEEVDLGEQTSFLDHVYLGCTRRHYETRKHISDNYRTMFESRISAGATEKPPSSETPNISTWSYDHAKKCVDDIVNWRTKPLTSFTRYQLRALMTIKSKKKT